MTISIELPSDPESQKKYLHEQHLNYLKRIYNLKLNQIDQIVKNELEEIRNLKKQNNNNNSNNNNRRGNNNNNNSNNRRRRSLTPPSNLGENGILIKEDNKLTEEELDDLLGIGFNGDYVGSSSNSTTSTTSKRRKLDNDITTEAVAPTIEPIERGIDSGHAYSMTYDLHPNGNSDTYYYG